MVARGRPTIQDLLIKLDNEITVLHRRLGGLPTNLLADSIWKNIWLEETHHSTALEGNTLTARELYYLVEQGQVKGNKEFRYYLEAEGYAAAAKWVYEEAAFSFKQGEFSFNESYIRQIHTLLMRPLWNSYPPLSGDRPGDYRHTNVRITGAVLRPVPAGQVAELMAKWTAQAAQGPGNVNPVSWAASLHADFEKIHPFVDGNGRAGRLLMNYLLISHGYPPAIILKQQRNKYLTALERAQQKGDYRALIELVARSVRDNLDRLLLPSMTSETDLIPLAVLSQNTGYKHAYLRRLVQEGKLKGLKENNLWLSSQKWFSEYLHEKSNRGRKLLK